VRFLFSSPLLSLADPFLSALLVCRRSTRLALYYQLDNSNIAAVYPGPSSASAPSCLITGFPSHVDRVPNSIEKWKKVEERLPAKERGTSVAELQGLICSWRGYYPNVCVFSFPFPSVICTDALVCSAQSPLDPHRHSRRNRNQSCFSRCTPPAFPLHPLRPDTCLSTGRPPHPRRRRSAPRDRNLNSPNFPFPPFPLFRFRLYSRNRFCCCSSLANALSVDSHLRAA
jgi:hypothetical protein